MNKQEEAKLLEVAEHYFRSGDVAFAEPLLSSILKSNDSNSKANELLAYIATNKGNTALGFELLKKANSSLDCSPEATYYLGKLYLSRGDMVEAIACLQLALKNAGDFFEGLHDLGMALAQLGLHDEALLAYEKARILRADSHTLYNNLAKSLTETNQYSKALSAYEYALKLNPNIAKVWSGYSAVLKYLERKDDALLACKRALQISPDDFDALSNLGIILDALKLYAEALAAHDRVLAMCPHDEKALSNKGLTLKNMARYEEALACYEQSLNLVPDNYEVWTNKGIALSALTRYDDALACYQRSLDICPTYADAHWNEALIKLIYADFAVGWEKYEYRWARKEASFYRHSDIAVLKNIDDVKSKNILIWAEQGLGDTIQFSRYVKLLHERGAKVTFEVQAPLYGLMRSVCDCTVINKGDPVVDMDLQSPLLSLPFLFKTDSASIPRANPYLKIAPEKILAWKNKLALTHTKLNIGIACSGNVHYKNDGNRSMLLKEFLPLAQEVNLFLVQKDVRPEDQQCLQQYPQIKFLGDQIHDFEDTGAIIKNMDVVISVDTSLAHLAGALGKTVYILLPWASEWRWLLNRSDSPWYPSARLFRQQSMGDWSLMMKSVVQSILLSQKFK